MTQADGERRKKWVNMFNEKGFWEGGVVPNTHNDERSLASFQLFQKFVNLNPKP